MAKPTLSNQKWFLASENWGHLLVGWWAAAGLTWLLQDCGRLASGPSPGPLPWQLTCLHGSQPSPDTFLTWLSSHLEEGRCCYSDVDGSRGVKCSRQEHRSCCAKWTLLSHVACQVESSGMPWGGRVPQPSSASPQRERSILRSVCSLLSSSHVAPAAVFEPEVEQEIQAAALPSPCLSCCTCGYICLMVVVVVVVNWMFFLTLPNLFAQVTICLVVNSSQKALPRPLRNSLPVQISQVY